MLHRSRFNVREDETPEPEDLPDLEADREVIADVIRSLAERYSAEEISTALDQLLGELEAHDQPRH